MEPDDVRQSRTPEEGSVKTPCDEWQGAIGSHGYGVVTRGGRQYLAHRVVLAEKLGRPIAVGMKALHACDNPPCVNPDHLHEGSQAQNLAEMIARGRHRNQRAECKRGHSFSGDNLYVLPDGRRVCRTCRRETKARYLARKRSVLA